MDRPPPPRKGLILALACAGQFMVVLDLAIVNVALPTIQQDLSLEPSMLQWVVIAYGLMLGGFLLLGGRLADHLGRRPVLLAGLAVFSATSLLAGLSDSGELLVGARVLQGLGAALIPPAALAIIATTFTEGGERNRALGLYGAVTGMSASIGVIASGLLTDGAGWRWVFLINVPIGVALIAVGWAALPRDPRLVGRRERFDVAGAVTATGSLLLLAYGRGRGAQDQWGGGITVATLVGSLALMVAFVWVERRSRSPLVPASVVHNRTLVAANASALLAFGAIFAFIFLGSLFMQQALGYSPTQTGLAWLAMTTASFVAAGAAGAKLVAAVGIRPLLVLGMCLLGGAAALMARVPGDGAYATDVLPALLLAGTAGGLAAPAAQIAALTGVSEAMTGLASGLIETVREIGGAICVAVVATVLVAQAATTTTDPAAGVSTDAFHDGFLVIVLVSALGAVVAAVGFAGHRAGAQRPERVRQAQS